MALMSLKNINVKFNKSNGFFSSERHIHVLKNLNLDIERGEIIALVGESGCGKTTAGKVITGLIRPTSGEVYFDGKLLYGAKRSKKTNTLVQFVQQDSYAALNPVKTIRESLKEALKCVDKKLKGERLNQKLEELMSLIGLMPAEQYLNKYPHNLSGGQRQRLLMARAIAFGPKIIVADEPVSMIDVSLRLSILNLMSKLNEELGISFVYITHDLSTARYIADKGRICVMYLGEIVESGSVNKILKNPRHPYTQALIKAVPDLYNKNDDPLPLIGMELASLENRGNGCSFANRCPYRTEKCDEPVPELQSDGTMVRCFYAEKI